MTGFLMWFYRPRVCSLLTSGFSEICLAQDRMMRIASMLVSGKPEFDENSDKHFTASWKESIVAEKCSLKIRSIRQEHNKSMIPQSYKKVPTCGQKSKFNNGCITIWSCKVKHGENIFPTRLDLVSFSINHLSQTSNHHVSDSDGPEARVVGIKYAQHNKDRATNLLISFHDVLKWSEEVFLKPKISEFAFLQKFHRQLAQGIHNKESNFLTRQTANLVNENLRHYMDYCDTD